MSREHCGHFVRACEEVILISNILAVCYEIEMGAWLEHCTQMATGLAGTSRTKALLSSRYILSSYMHTSGYDDSSHIALLN